MFKISLLFLSFCMLALQAEYKSASLLAPYEEYLEEGTNTAINLNDFVKLPKSRFETFKKAFELFEKNKGKVIVELGTSRSFTHGGLPGCNLDDPIYWTPENPENWDWGAGFFTRMAAHSLSYLKPEIHTVDLIRSHIKRCKVMTKDFQHLITYHVSSSEDYLTSCDFPNQIDLLYLDTGDMTPIEPTALLQLAEAKIIVKRNLIAPKGLILIDDVLNKTPKEYGDSSGLGKSKYALPYLVKNGFKIIMNEYQVLLEKQ